MQSNASKIESPGGTLDNMKLEANWHQLKGRIRSEFGKLTDDDMEQVRGNKERLIGKIEQRYSETRDAATRKLNALLEAAADAA
jgi:uncharacterized protein YjbJ (UPF0337 family)